MLVIGDVQRHHFHMKQKEVGVPNKQLIPYELFLYLFLFLCFVSPTVLMFLRTLEQLVMDVRHPPLLCPVNWTFATLLKNKYVQLIGHTLFFYFALFYSSLFGCVNSVQLTGHLRLDIYIHYLYIQ